MPFQSGTSGNLQGRPVGVPDKRSILRNMINPNMENLVKKAIEMALEGNEQMLRLLLDRVLPVRPRDNPIPNLKLTGSSIERVAYLTELLNGGLITPMQYEVLLSCIERSCKIGEVAEFKRILIEMFSFIGNSNDITEIKGLAGVFQKQIEKL